MAETANEPKRSLISLTVSKDSMVASILLRQPKPDEPPITAEDILKVIEDGGVVYGVDRDAIEKAVVNKEFNTPLKIAAGHKPRRGVPASFIYHFDTNESRKPKEGDDGHIDYKDISFIQNTEKGAVLVTKVPPTEGKPGMTVLGKEIAGPSGRDIPFNIGVNTEVAEDELKLIASASGAIQFQYGKVSVNDVVSIRGDVDHNVGNIDCKGSVTISGGIKAGFIIKVEGDLEVNGNVEDCEIDVGGDIAVKGGFFGEGTGIMKAGGDITIKYAEGQNLHAGNEIHVGAEIVNCTVTAGQKVIVKSRKGKIVGGDVRASKIIRASALGSEAGTATNLTVGFDQDLMDKYTEVKGEIERQAEDGERVKEALYALYRIQMDGKLPPEKQAAMDKLEMFQEELPASLETLAARKKEIEAELAKFADARIIAEEKIYPGVKASFGVVYRDILEDMDRCSLSLEGSKILASEVKDED